MIPSVYLRWLPGPVWRRLCRRYLVGKGYTVELPSITGDIASNCAVLAVTSWGYTLEARERTLVFCQDCQSRKMPVVLVVPDPQAVDAALRDLVTAVASDTDLDGLERELERVEITAKRS